MIDAFIRKQVPFRYVLADVFSYASAATMAVSSLTSSVRASSRVIARSRFLKATVVVDAGRFVDSGFRDRPW